MWPHKKIWVHLDLPQEGYLALGIGLFCMLRKGCRSTLHAGESLRRHLLHLLHERGPQVCWQARLRGEPWPRCHSKACGSKAPNHTETQSPILTLHAIPVNILDISK